SASSNSYSARQRPQTTSIEFHHPEQSECISTLHEDQDDGMYHYSSDYLTTRKYEGLFRAGEAPFSATCLDLASFGLDSVPRALFAPDSSVAASLPFSPTCTPEASDVADFATCSLARRGFGLDAAGALPC